MIAPTASTTLSNYSTFLCRMSRILPDEFGFVPKTWIFPSEYSAFQTYTRELKKKKKSKTFIVKPANGAMGNGYVHERPK